MAYQYFIKSIPVQYGRDGYSMEDYEKHIQTYAAKGWRFIQVVNLVDISPKNRKVDLIFEKEVEEDGL